MIASKLHALSLSMPKILRAGISMRADQRQLPIQVGSVVITLAIWEWYGRGVDPIFLSYPTAIIAAVPKMIVSGELQNALFTSLQSLVFGLSMAIVIGMSLGLLMGRYRTIDAILSIRLFALFDP